MIHKKAAATLRAAPTNASSLKIGRSDDPLEHEADRVADHVTRIRGGPDSSSLPQVGRTFADCGGGLALQTKHAGAGNALSEAPPAVYETLSSPGQPFDAESRAYFEPRFGADFSHVSIHADGRAADSARTMHANAYTVGRHVVFGPDQYAPGTAAGRRLIAHELAHVIQQRRPEAARAGQGNCEEDAENAAQSVGSGIAPMVQTGAVFGVVQRQPSAAPIDGPKAQKKSRLVRIERYSGSTSARAFFADGSNEEVTFVDTKSLDGDTRPEGTLETVVNLTIDRSSLIRPRVEHAPRTSGSKVVVVTRPSPADRISRLPAKVRGEVSEAFLGDTEYQPDPETMEFAADMGDRLKEASDTMRIEMEGRDPATIATMQTVDQWVSEQKGTLDKVGTLYRARFTHLLSDIRQIGVTGRVAGEDLNAQDVELVLAGAAGGQSEFQTFDEFKRRMKFDLRSGRTSIPEENADNPDFFVRNEYRKAWKAEAEGLRKMSRRAAAAQAAPFLAIGASAAAGTGLFALELGAAGLAARGIPYALQAKWAATSLFATGALSNFLAAREEAKAAGMDPNSPLGIGNAFSAAVLKTSGIGEVSENATNTSILTGKSLDRSVTDRILGGTLGLLDTVGLAYSFGPKSPGKLPDAPDSSAAKAGIKDADTTVGPDPPVSTHLPDPPARPVAQAAGGRTSQSAELYLRGPHQFFTKPAANQNITLPPPEAQVAKIPLAKTGTGDHVSARIAVDETAQTGTGAGGTKMSGPPKSTADVDPLAGPVPRPLDLEKGSSNVKPAVEGGTPSATGHAPAAGTSPATSDTAQRIASLSREIKALEQQEEAARAAATAAWNEALRPKNNLARGVKLTPQERALVDKHNDLMRQRREITAQLTAKRAERAALRPSPFSKEGRAVSLAREKHLPAVLGDILGKGNVFFKPKIARVGTAQLPIPLTEGTIPTKQRGWMGISTSHDVTPEVVAKLPDGRNMMFDAKGESKYSHPRQKYTYEGLEKDGQGVVVVGKPGLKAGEVVHGKVVLMGPDELNRLAANPTIETLMEIIGP